MPLQGVRNRIICGMIPFDEVWVIRAHDSTTIEIGKLFVVDGTEIPEGIYVFFTIPSKKFHSLYVRTGSDAKFVHYKKAKKSYCK